MRWETVCYIANYHGKVKPVLQTCAIYEEKGPIAEELEGRKIVFLEREVQAEKSVLGQIVREE